MEETQGEDYVYENSTSGGTADPLTYLSIEEANHWSLWQYQNHSRQEKDQDAFREQHQQSSQAQPRMQTLSHSQTQAQHSQKQTSHSLSQDSLPTQNGSNWGDDNIIRPASNWAKESSLSNSLTSYLDAPTPPPTPTSNSLPTKLSNPLLANPLLSRLSTLNNTANIANSSSTGSSNSLSAQGFTSTSELFSSINSNMQPNTSFQQTQSDVSSSINNQSPNSNVFPFHLRYLPSLPNDNRVPLAQMHPQLQRLHLQRLQVCLF